MSRLLSRLGMVSLALSCALAAAPATPAWAEGELDATPAETQGEASATEDEAQEFSVREGSAPNLIQAQAACLTDDSGNVLYSYDADVEMPMASITKVMTAMVAYDSGVDLKKKFPFKVEQYQDDAQLVGLADGDKISLGDLITVTLVYSGNDTASNIAFAVSGSEEAFVELMNQKAAQLGMEHTHFKNPHGLNENGHYSSAADLCTMGRYALEHYPGIRAAVTTRQVMLLRNNHDVTLSLDGTATIKDSEKKDDYSEMFFYSTDDLMEEYEGLRGIKTGRVESGCSFLGSARRDGVTLYSCVLNCDDPQVRFGESAILLDWGFDCYEERTLADARWCTRVAGWQDGFWLKCPIAPTRTSVGRTQTGQDLSYKTVALKPNALVGSGEAIGSTTWTQSDRPVGSVSYESGKYHTRVRAWNPLVLPLFEHIDSQ